MSLTLLVDGDDEAAQLLRGSTESSKRFQSKFFAVLWLLGKLFGGWRGLTGLGIYFLGLTLSILMALGVGWLAGMISMVAVFFGAFSFGAVKAAQGKYDIARPVLIGSLLIIGSSVLASHFFVEFRDYSSSVVYRNIGVETLPKHAHFLSNTIFYFSDGSVDTSHIGETKFCASHLPILNKCVYKYLLPPPA